jgi:amino acid permease
MEFNSAFKGLKVRNLLPIIFLVLSPYGLIRTIKFILLIAEIRG